MTDLLSWTINVGRWAGTRVHIHVFLIVFAAARLLEAVLSPAQSVVEALGTLLLLLAALAVHELGHAVMAARLDVDREEVRLWPLGNLVGPSTSPASRSPEAVTVALAGPLASALVALGLAVGLFAVGVRMEFNPFGAGGGTPRLASGDPAEGLSAAWWIGRFGFINWVIALANLIPALPMDGGRVLRGVLASRSRDSMIAPYTGRAIAIVCGLVGVFTLFNGRYGALIWIGLAVLFWVMVRIEIHMYEDSGFFEEGGVFGYDFSQGYTSLEAQAPRLRPHPESALTRWQRRRSELRRERREAQEAAEVRRMDEILLKIHEQGRGSLTDEEQRFLVRVSTRLRTKRTGGS